MREALVSPSHVSVSLGRDVVSTRYGAAGAPRLSSRVMCVNVVYVPRMSCYAALTQGLTRVPAAAPADARTRVATPQ